MAGHNLRLFPVLADESGGLFGHVLVTGAVEAVATDAIFLIIFVWQGIEIGLGGHGAVERGVEHCRHRDARKHFLHGRDALQSTRIVQRGKVDEFLDQVNDVVVDEDAVAELLAAVGHAVTDGVDFLQVLDDTHLRVDQSLEHQFDAFGVVRDGELFVMFFTVVFVGEFAHFEADALQEAFGQQARRIGKVGT